VGANDGLVQLPATLTLTLMYQAGEAQHAAADRRTEHITMHQDWSRYVVVRAEIRQLHRQASHQDTVLNTAGHTHQLQRPGRNRQRTFLQPGNQSMNTSTKKPQHHAKDPHLLHPYLLHAPTHTPLNNNQSRQRGLTCSINPSLSTTQMRSTSRAAAPNCCPTPAAAAAAP